MQLATDFLSFTIITLTIYSIVNDERPLPAKAATEEADKLLFADEPYIESPIKVDYGTNLRYRETSCPYNRVLSDWPL